MKFLKSNDSSTPFLKLVIITGAAVLGLRALLATDTFHSSLLYIAWPFSISLAIYYFTPHTDGSDWKKQFWNLFRGSTIVLLASSLFLMEGYVCIIMAMPLFFLGFLLAFGASYLRNRRGKNTMSVALIPLIVALVSIEGVFDATTFQRYNKVVYSQVVHSNVDSIRQKLATPPKPSGKRHWLLSVFPMPKTIGNVRLSEGAVRVYEFEYHRWFATNTHRGEIRVTFVNVDEGGIKTKIEDTSYIASYMNLLGTELKLKPIDEKSTFVTLTIEFERMIDPVWYFEPLERFAVKKAAQYFIGALLSKWPQVVASHKLGNT